MTAEAPQPQASQPDAAKIPGIGWVRALVAILMTLVWAGLNVLAAVAPEYDVGWPIHILFGIVLAALFPEGAKAMGNWVKGRGRTNGGSS